MKESTPLIGRGDLGKGALEGRIVLVTGGGGGIGLEAARALAWLGARIVIAEIDRRRGRGAEAALTAEFGADRVLFVRTDIGSRRGVARLGAKARARFGRIDAILNNATVVPVGAAHEVGARSWNSSYRVNLRGPVLLLEEFLPGMKERDSGVVAFVPSSGAAPNMGAYESLKTAQVELSNCLAAELDGTGVAVFSIGPGLVRTETAERSIGRIAPSYGLSVEEFFAMSDFAMLSAEAAGAGFAAAIAAAERYRGLEIGSIQALADAGIDVGQGSDGTRLALSEEARAGLLSPLSGIKRTFEEQSRGWRERPLFERQWLLRDFKKYASDSPEGMLSALEVLERGLRDPKPTAAVLERSPIPRLRAYYERQLELLLGYERDETRRTEHEAVIRGWIAVLDAFLDMAARALSTSRNSSGN